MGAEANGLRLAEVRVNVGDVVRKGQVLATFAADTIAALAAKGKYDLLMMGSHGHGSFKSLLMGSVATKVLSHTHIPVLLIR